ncbi:MIP family Ig-specific serine endopeptidase [Mycoplasmopsis iners]|uniref:MIP family Ig-specific serine endopeptidase n=1 Tax=Mycoplasmopsis iners TaxID=76630 RepID=UPI0004958312|nr:hypothetical protein [Mycoplasmopsis iners]
MNWKKIFKLGTLTSLAVAPLATYSCIVKQDRKENVELIFVNSQDQTIIKLPLRLKKTELENYDISTLVPNGFALSDEAEKIVDFSSNKTIKIVVIQKETPSENDDKEVDDKTSNIPEDNNKEINLPIDSTPEHPEVPEKPNEPISETNNPDPSIDNGSNDESIDNPDNETVDEPRDNSIRTAAEYYEVHPEANRYNYGEPEYFKYDTNLQYLESIKNRTFSFLTVFDNDTTTAGTIWMLDYKKISDREYKFFFGTNHHVAVELYSSNDYEIYKQPNRENQITSIIFGINNNISDANGKSYNFYRINDVNKFPRNFFLARNFMKDEVYSKHDRSYYADFAVIEWDVNFNEWNLRNPDALAIAKRLLTGIAEIDKTLEKVKTNKLSMNDQKLPYASLDYSSVWELRNNIIGLNEKSVNEITTWNKAEQVDKFITKYYEYGENEIYNYYYKPHAIYAYGHPLIKTSTNTVVGTFYNVMDQDFNTLDRSDWISHKQYWLLMNELHNAAVADHGNQFNGEDLPYYYGMAYQSSQRTKIHGGASGSLVINQDGLPIGVLFGSLKSDAIVYLNDENKWETNHTMLIAPFSQEVPMWGTTGMIYPFNLIDGRNKTKYQYQKTSYKERLIEVYGENYTTAIFA